MTKSATAQMLLRLSFVVVLETVYALIERTPAVRPAIRLHNRWKARRWRTSDIGLPDGLTGRLPVPPAELRLEVANSGEAESFLQNGAMTATTLRQTLARNRVALSGSVLDFGCGSGRVARHLRDADIELVGCDPSRAAIDWCQLNLPFMKAVLSDYMPPLPFHDSCFDLVYAFSIFTHLREDLQRAWIEDLSRVIRPGGYLLLTTHGRVSAERLLDPSQNARFDRGDLVVVNQGACGMNRCGAFHPAGWFRARVSNLFDLIDYEENGVTAAPGADLYLWRRI